MGCCQSIELKVENVDLRLLDPVLDEYKGYGAASFLSCKNTGYLWLLAKSIFRIYCRKLGAKEAKIYGVAVLRSI